MNLGRSITFAFEDQAWLSKLGLGALLSFVPIVNFAWQGYLIHLTRNVAAGQVHPLPTWDDFERKLLDGLKITAALLIYALPSFVLLAGPVLFVLPALTENADLQTILATLATGVTLVLGCAWFLYLLVFSFFAPAIQLNFARHNTFGACFQFGQILGLIRAHTSDYVTAWAMTMLVSLAYSVVFSSGMGFAAILPCLGFVLMLALIPLNMLGAMWLTTVQAYLFGQVGLAREAGTDLSSP